MGVLYRSFLKSLLMEMPRESTFIVYDYIRVWDAFDFYSRFLKIENGNIFYLFF